MSRSAELNLNLHPKQGEAFQTPATEVLYGGAAGSGKSHLIRVAAIYWSTAIAGLQVYLFRRIRDDLIKNHMEGPKGFRALLAGWTSAGFVTIVEDEIRFWNGSKVYLCHCKDHRDVYKYQGAEIHVLLIDELTHFLETMYRFLRSRVRMVGLAIPEELKGKFPRILCGANPGNVGHAFVKSSFIDGALPLEVRRMPEEEGGMLRQYIPARLDDNPSMLTDDPGYEAKLSGMGSAELVKAMREGDWSVVEGAFFDCWSNFRHVLRPFTVPEHWMRFRSMDWGSAAPFSVGWWAVASEDHIAETIDGKPAVVPRGALVRFREWYGAKKDASGRTIPNVGLKMKNEDIGAGIKERETLRLKDESSGKEHFVREEITYGVLDPRCFANEGGTPIAEAIFKGGAMFRQADNARVREFGAASGWGQVRGRLIGNDDGHPMIFCFSTCVDSIRTIPVLQHDPDRPEDLDTTAEDHAADDWRYACNSRPWMKAAPKKAEPVHPRWPTFKELTDAYDRQVKLKRTRI
jgi:hypothetical protein